MDSLLKPVQYLKGVGPQRSRLLARMDIYTVFDLIWHVPRTYFNRGNTMTLEQLETGDQANVSGTIINTRSGRSRKGMSIFSAVVKVQEGTLLAVWFNQPFVADVIKNGQKIWLTGKVKSSLHPEIHVSEYEVFDEEEESSPGIVPIYPVTEGITQKVMRSLVGQILTGCLMDYPEILSPDQRVYYKLCTIHEALYNLHFPADRNSYHAARQRLAFEEMLLFQLRLRQSAVKEAVTGIVHREHSDLVNRILSRLPYELTSAQRKVVQEIFADMETAVPMNRLLQGDVGAGKTVVAALAIAKAVASGYQAAFMAPTEILAVQHGQALQNIYHNSSVSLGLLTGSSTAAERRVIQEQLSRGELDVLVGTHALIQEGISFQNLGLVVIDEQHRFGVRQRAALVSKGNHPDTLVMTATPIPRTLALTAYGNLDISVIDQLPPGRKPVKTKHVAYRSRAQAYDFVRQELLKGRQAYIVCPLVEESEEQDLQAAVNLYDELRSGIFREWKVGLLHGRLKPFEKEEVMSQFKTGDVNLLVTTTVVEVGVDVANASVMVIEHAERFGLSQLHQLRGRVGRGDFQSYCVLLAESHTEESLQRLRAMEASNDGFYLAQQDLAIRGPGEFWGVRQHGLDQLKVADLAKDMELAEKARQCSRELEPRSWNQYINARYPIGEGTTMN